MIGEIVVRQRVNECAQPGTRIFSTTSSSDALQEMHFVLGDRVRPGLASSHAPNEEDVRLCPEPRAKLFRSCRADPSMK